MTERATGAIVSMPSIDAPSVNGSVYFKSHFEFFCISALIIANFTFFRPMPFLFRRVIRDWIRQSVIKYLLIVAFLTRRTHTIKPFTVFMVIANRFKLFANHAYFALV